MPRGQYTRKKPTDAEPVTAAPESDETPDIDEEQAADETSDADDADDASNDDGTVVEPAEQPEDPAPEQPKPATADSADNVLYPMDDNPAACPGPLCPACFPLGWPIGAEQAVGCEHGLWLRQWPPTAE